MATKVALATDAARDRTKRRAGPDRWPLALALQWQIPGPGRCADRVQRRSAMAKHWIRLRLHGDRRSTRHRSLRSWSPRRPKADPEDRVSLLTCVGTAGFEPATT